MGEKDQRKEGGDDYDPHEHRKVAKPTTNFQAFVNFLKASIGTGVLAMPSAFSNAGFALGLVFTFALGLIILHTLRILISSMYELCKRKRVPYLQYSEAMKAGLEGGPRVFKCLIPIATPMVDSFLAFYHFGICSVYVFFTAESVKQVVDEYWIELNLRIHMCIVLVPIFLIFCIRNLKMLATFSAFANALLILGFGVLFYYIFTDFPSITDRRPFADISKLPLYFGTVLFALEAVGVVLAIEESMKTPKSYLKPCGVMDLGMVIVITLFALIGFFGYWKYGDEALGSVTLNIPQDAILAQIVKILFAITIMISYSLQGYVVVGVVWHKYLSKRVKDESKHVLFELLVRVGIAMLSLLAAVSVPNLALFLSLVGAFSLSFLGLIFPAILQICVHHAVGYGPYKIKLVKNIVLIVFGAMGGVLGTAVSIIDIIAQSS